MFYNNILDQFSSNSNNTMALAQILQNLHQAQVADGDNFTTADFLSGGYAAAWGEDVHTEMRACFTQSDDLDLIMNNAMNGLAAGNTDYFYAQVMRSLSYWEQAVQSCKDTPAVWDLCIKTQQYWDNFTGGEDDYDATIGANYDANQHTLDGYATNMTDAWDHGLDFQAGQFMGLASAILLQPSSIDTVKNDKFATEFAETLAKMTEEIFTLV